MIQPFLIGQRTSYRVIVLMNYEVIAVGMLVPIIEVAEIIDRQFGLT